MCREMSKVNIFVTFVSHCVIRQMVVRISASNLSTVFPDWQSNGW